MKSADSEGAGETALESIPGLRPEETARLVARRASFRSAMKALRTAASGEEPLFAPELESPFEPHLEDAP